MKTPALSRRTGVSTPQSRNLAIASVCKQFLRVFDAAAGLETGWNPAQTLTEHGGCAEIGYSGKRQVCAALGR
jgi:hypothetical protein